MASLKVIVRHTYAHEELNKILGCPIQLETIKFESDRATRYDRDTTSYCLITGASIFRSPLQLLYCIHQVSEQQQYTKILDQQ